MIVSHSVESHAERVAYTVGAERQYDAALLDVVFPPRKLGARGAQYDGGWVWRDIATAKAFIGSHEFNAAFGNIPPKCAVYEIKLQSTWEASVNSEPSAIDGVHRLLLDAPIVKKVG